MSGDSPRAWRAFLRRVIVTGVVLGAAIATAIVAIDPHDQLGWIRPAGWPVERDRVPIDARQRFSYPSLARKARFDSLVLGTSTMRLLRPERLDAAFGARFANLSMNSATAYEQARMLELFARHHERIEVLLIGIDVSWCTPGPLAIRYTRRIFPEWMYDENPWNDLPHLLNWNTLEQALRMAEFWTGRRSPRFARDGYASFLPPRSEYDLPKAQANIYGPGGPRPVPAALTGAAASPPADVPPFGVHVLVDWMLARIPAETVKILFFVPYHRYTQAVPGTPEGAKWAACKSRLAERSSRVPGLHVVDAMIDSAITREDENYWDGLHYSVEVADRLPALLFEAVANRRGVPDLLDYLQ